MSDKRLSSDAFEWAYNRYIKGNPEREACFKEAGRQADLAQQVYDIRNRLHMSRDDVAEFSGLTPESIEDIEESDYDGGGKSRKNTMRDELFKDLFESVRQAGAIKRGEMEPSRVFTVETPDAESIGAESGVSETELASLPGISCCTVKAE